MWTVKTYIRNKSSYGYKEVEISYGLTTYEDDITILGVTHGVVDITDGLDEPDDDYYRPLDPTDSPRRLTKHWDEGDRD
jgi:hypothetical protein